MGKLLSALLVLSSMNAFGQYDLIIEQVDAGELGIAYQFYVEANNPTDKLSAIFGNDQSPTVFNTPNGVTTMHSARNASRSQHCYLFSLSWTDSYATMSVDQPRNARTRPILFRCVVVSD